MADYLLDTNILSLWYDTAPDQSGKLKDTHQNIVSHVNRIRQHDQLTGEISHFFISVITLGEMHYGHRVVLSPDLTKQDDYAKFVREQCPIALEITAHIAEQYGQMRAWLFNNCSPNTLRNKANRAEQLVFPATGRELGIDENDLWIAAQAMTHNLVLVTHDWRGNFGKVLSQYATTLIPEDWAI